MATNEVQNCPICLNDLPCTNNFVVTCCNHRFCLPCFLTAMESNDKCPSCRAVVRSKNKFDDDDDDDDDDDYDDDVEETDESDDDDDEYTESAETEEDDSDEDEEDLIII